MPYVRKTIYHKDRFGLDYGTGTRHYCIWSGMRKRGLGKDKTNNYKYFDKGITICDEWLSYAVFAEWSVKNGYNNTLTIDRIDNAKGYSPENCRWATVIEQARNKSSVKFYTLDGFTGCITDWAAKTGIKRKTIEQRMKAYGWEFAKAVTTPVRLHKGGNFAP